MKHKGPKPWENPIKLKCFCWVNIDSQNIGDGIQIQVYKIVTDFRKYILVQVKEILRKSQAQFWKQLRKLRLRQNDAFPKKQTCMSIRAEEQLGVALDSSFLSYPSFSQNSSDLY